MSRTKPTQASLRYVRWGAPPVVTPIEAGIVGRTTDTDPVGLVDSAAVWAGPTQRKRAGQLDPAILLAGDHTNLVSGLRKILVLAQDQSDVVLAAVCHANDVESDSDVDALLLARPETVDSAVRELHRPPSKAKRTAIDLNPLPADRTELRLPEPMPAEIVSSSGNAGVEPCLNQSPPAILAQPDGERMNVIVRMPVAEGLSCGVEEILPVDEDCGALDRRLERAQRGRGRKK